MPCQHCSSSVTKGSGKNSEVTALRSPWSVWIDQQVGRQSNELHTGIYNSIKHLWQCERQGGNKVLCSCKISQIAVINRHIFGHFYCILQEMLELFRKYCGIFGPPLCSQTFIKNILTQINLVLSFSVDLFFINLYKSVPWELIDTCSTLMCSGSVQTSNRNV